MSERVPIFNPDSDPGYLAEQEKQAAEYQERLDLLSEEERTVHEDIDPRFVADGIVYKWREDIGEKGAAHMLAGATPENTRGSSIFEDLFEPDEASISSTYSEAKRKLEGE